MRRFTMLLLIALLVACQTTAPDIVSAAPPATAAPLRAEPTPVSPVRVTEVRDQAALERLRGNAGLSLQWISWEKRGILEVSQRGSVVHLSGSQATPDGTGRLEIEGDVLSIDSNSFIMRGQIRIVGTPDAGRSCAKENDSEFAITQDRKYWRMREFEWCDELTDYIDIYF